MGSVEIMKENSGNNPVNIGQLNTAVSKTLLEETDSLFIMTLMKKAKNYGC